jgi:hypothetical protein
MREFEVSGSVEVSRVEIGPPNKIKCSQRFKSDLGHPKEPTPIYLVGPLGLSSNEKQAIAATCKPKKAIDMSFHSESGDRNTFEAHAPDPGGKQLHHRSSGRKQVDHASEWPAPLRMVTNFFSNDLAKIKPPVERVIDVCTIHHDQTAGGKCVEAFAGEAAI